MTTYNPLDTGEVLDAIDARRAAVVTIAKGEIGDQKKGSPIVLGYWRDVGVLDAAGKPCNDWQVRQIAGCIPPAKGREWCQTFALWCYHAANLTREPARLGTTFARKLPRTRAPEPGDLVLYPGALGHHGILEERYERNGRIWIRTIEGNTPTVVRRDAPERTGIAYYSILPWIKSALEILQ